MPSRLLPVATVVLTAACLAGCTSSGGSSTPTGSAAPGRSTSPATTSAAAPTASPSTSASGVAPLARFTSLGGGSTTMRFLPSFVRALYTKAITTTASGDARLTPIGSSSQITLPITGGSATVYPGTSSARSTVTARHSGSGLRLGNAAGTTVRIDGFVLTLGRTPQITAELATEANGATGPSRPVTLFTVKVTTSATTATLKSGVVTLRGLRLDLTPSARTALDAALNTSAFDAGGSYAADLTVTLSRG